jgi:hypothetical protein
MYIVLKFLFTAFGWLAAVPPCVRFAGRLFGGMDSKPGGVPGICTKPNKGKAYAFLGTLWPNDV